MATRVKIGKVDEEVKETVPEEENTEAISGRVDEVASQDTDESPQVEADEDGIDIATLDPELEVWPGGPTVGETLAWKDEFGEVYSTSLTPEFHIMWRPINRLEYKQHVKHMEQLSQTGKLSPVELNMFQEEALAELCVLHPKYTRADMSTSLAGMPSIIAQQVMEASGFTALEVRQL